MNPKINPKLIADTVTAYVKAALVFLVWIIIATAAVTAGYVIVHGIFVAA